MKIFRNLIKRSSEKSMDDVKTGWVSRVVLLAAGRSERFGIAEKKQFSILAGKPVFLYSLEAFANLQPFTSGSSLAQIVIVLPEGDLAVEAEKALSTFEAEHERIEITRVTGGPRRQDSVAAGLRAFSGSCDIALVHDSARPFFPFGAIPILCFEADKLGAAIFAERVTDTLKIEDASGNVGSTLDRNKVWRAQTPQAFRGEYIGKIIERLRSEIDYTDEASALESLGVTVDLIEAPDTNFKITSPDDLTRAEACLKRWATVTSSPSGYAYLRDIIALVKIKGEYSWYITGKEIWFLDYRKWSSSGNPDAIAKNWRGGIACVDESTVGEFLEFISDGRAKTEDLRELIVRRGAARSKDSIIEFIPGAYVDFDSRRLISLFPEPGGSFEFYVPDGWTGEYGDFLAEVPPELRYWVIDGVDVIEKHMSEAEGD